MSISTLIAFLTHSTPLSANYGKESFIRVDGLPTFILVYDVK